MSSTISSATPEEFFHRCAADWNQIKNGSKLPVPIHGRLWSGMLANLDECYDFLTSFSLLSAEEGGKSDRKAAKINPYQSALNKLLQFGNSARATKTAGSYGEGDLRNGISFGVTSNIHPSTYIPMERGESGTHFAACKERFLVSTGRPVQPHQDLPGDFVMPPGRLDSCKQVSIFLQMNTSSLSNLLPNSSDDLAKLYIHI